MNDIPLTERAVQLVGPDKLELNSAKPVADPGPHQVLARVEAVGLCFSDLKLLKQFSQHSRKSVVLTGLDAQALAEMPITCRATRRPSRVTKRSFASSKSGRASTATRPASDLWSRPTIAGCRRTSPTPPSATTSKARCRNTCCWTSGSSLRRKANSMLIPAPESLSASALALIEPWACVENAYTEVQRRTLKPGGRLLVVGDAAVDRAAVERLPGRPGSIVFRPAPLSGTFRTGATTTSSISAPNPRPRRSCLRNSPPAAC